jgi:hypothetical protein
VTFDIIVTTVILDAIIAFVNIVSFGSPLAGSRGSSVSFVTDYGLHDRGSIPDRSRGFFF